ncbi:DNA/RNA nuclease SfsA [Clostridium grantii]|uniref:Sugar fermentation stimulation protein homolog n=1 Tax=Clostridium grantii DSM 8605 TaxID=1121316 RepID=A0A1M5Y4H3_9CLOT|nr:DNA/RNA nuclease SfsA [Clostridium grantii]SHI06995.1 sugar fermentation stimulation protein A [Clostridium grantii DSM 8605]
MKFNNKIIKTTFLRRPNRFQAYVILHGKEIMVHVPNTGRCREILKPNTDIILRKEDNPTRKTAYDLIAGYKDGKLINIDSQVPNKVVLEALSNKKIDKLIKYNIIEKEKTFGKSRFDFKLSNENKEIYYLEVKGVTLEEDGYCLFPDAPTERGTKHVLELIDVINNGMNAGILFLIQIEDVKCFSTNGEMDTKFAEAVKLAKNKGVDLFAYSCIVKEDSIELYKEIEIIL